MNNKDLNNLLKNHDNFVNPFDTYTYGYLCELKIHNGPSYLIFIKKHRLFDLLDLFLETFANRKLAQTIHVLGNINDAQVFNPLTITDLTDSGEVVVKDYMIFTKFIESFSIITYFDYEEELYK